MTRLEPLPLLNVDDLETCVRRAGLKPPANWQHYIEYLAGLALKGRLDPVTIFDLNDAKQELRRRGKVPPAKDQEMSERDYLEACIQRIDPTASSFDMGDGKEGERQPLLKNENITYSSHGSDAIGVPLRAPLAEDIGLVPDETQSTVNTVSPIGPDELPPPYQSATQGGMPMVTCRVCQAMIDISGKRDQHVVKCCQCNEATSYHTTGSIHARHVQGRLRPLP
ncbi:transmembrane protein 55b [Lasius niger]|uniref:Phosphatidylinositol-4,5-bisphosphate 4-phosphatase n=1 Tax=Lasius niger TaxID=67767 RepID=A0A0J7KM32_LASNI|nr:transmembrane protein 55b [Lasius niger]